MIDYGKRVMYEAEIQGLDKGEAFELYLEATKLYRAKHGTAKFISGDNMYGIAMNKRHETAYRYARRYMKANQEGGLESKMEEK